MAEVVMYTKNWCPYCVKAKLLLKKKGVDFTEINVEKDAAMFQKMLEGSGHRRTVPQIFVDGKHLGDCDEMYVMDKRGELDARLGLAAA